MTWSYSVVLARLGVQMTHESGQCVLDLAEHETRTAEIDPECPHSVLEEVFEVLSGAMEAGLISAETRRPPGERTCLVIEATSIVGVVSSLLPDGMRLFARVRPKVGTARMLELAVLAKMMPDWNGGVFVSESVEDALLEWTIGAFDHALHVLLARGGLRNTHERVNATLVNKVTGRLLVVPWLRNVSRGRPHLVPCEFPSLEFDNPVNRFLRWAIYVGITVARTVTRSDRLVERLEKRDRQFAGARLVRPPSPWPDPHALPANLRHYAQAVTLARLVLNNIRVGVNAGRVEGTSISLDMNKVYERAFCNCIQTLHPEAYKQDEWSVPLLRQSRDGSGAEVAKTMTMIPDIWIDGDQERFPIVMDTKWKQVFRKSEAVVANELSATGPVRLRPEDLYQATAYALETLHRRPSYGNEDITGCLAALIYPTTAVVSDLGREIRVGNARIIIQLVGWNVTVPAENEVREIWSRLTRLALRS
ncbi:5-methylcytosine restriction system specificity protein McrC [Massilia sp. BKSP1R2A-1]|uniref:5-methylcytosine restriction system specificity protein McrC n=1 Tax=Massilia sp. BKSP1R2A-1 TaxID=3422595 RepID=UPI003D34095D